MKMQGRRKAAQRGGFALGLIVGLLVGLTLALGVALYVTKVPVPFVNKVPMRTAEQDAAEVEKNKNWDPNAPLHGKTPVKPAPTAPGTSASGVVVNSTPPAAVPARAPNATLGQPKAGPAAVATNPVTPRNPADILADRPIDVPVAKIPPPPLSTRSSTDPFAYFVQAGAYARTEEAEQQRARLAMMGFEGRLTEREQAGRSVYRVRIGPFDHKDDAERAKEKLGGAGIESALVRVQK